MPKKNKVTVTTGEQVEPENVVMGVDGYESKGPELCGHISKHHYNSKGRLEDISCDFVKGHTGDHHAKYMKKVDAPETDVRGIVIEHHYHEEEADAYWGDAAGVPANEIKEGKTLQLTNFQKDILADIMNSDNSLSVEDALAKAKASPKWMAADA